MPETPRFHHKLSLRYRVSAIKALEILQFKYLSVLEPFWAEYLLALWETKVKRLAGFMAA